MKLTRGSALLHYPLAAALQIAVLLFRIWAGTLTGATPGLVLFILPVIASAYFGGLGPGLLSTAVAALLTDYFLLLPLGSFEISVPFNLLQWVVMILIGVVATIAMHKLRHAVERAEAADSASAKILQTLRLRTTQSPNAIAMFDRDLRYIAASVSWINSYCPRNVDPIGADLDQVTPHFPKSWKSFCQAGLDGNYYQTEELEWRRGDGSSVWLAVAISPWTDGHGETGGIIISLEDMTARHRLDEQLRLARDTAEAMDRAKSALLAGVSHELRTPLNGVIGFSEALLSEIFGPLPNPRQREYIADIHAAGLHLLELINDILDTSALLARQTALDVQPLDVGEVVATALRFVQPAADKAGVRLVSDCAADLPPLLADKRRIVQVLLNLLSNGVKFTREGGKVIVTARVDSGGDFVIAVADTGVGMSKTDLEMVRMPFAPQQDSFVQSRKGAGLGLYLAEGLVAIHGGSMSIESTRGVGTIVTLRFPPERSGASPAAPEERER